MTDDRIYIPVLWQEAQVIDTLVGRLGNRQVELDFFLPYDSHPDIPVRFTNGAAGPTWTVADVKYSDLSSLIGLYMDAKVIVDNRCCDLFSKLSQPLIEDADLYYPNRFSHLPLLVALAGQSEVATRASHVTPLRITVWAPFVAHLGLPIEVTTILLPYLDGYDDAIMTIVLLSAKLFPDIRAVDLQHELQLSKPGGWKLLKLLVERNSVVRSHTIDLLWEAYELYEPLSIKMLNAIKMLNPPGGRQITPQLYGKVLPISLDYTNPRVWHHPIFTNIDLLAKAIYHLDRLTQSGNNKQIAQPPRFILDQWMQPVRENSKYPLLGIGVFPEYDLMLVSKDPAAALVALGDDEHLDPDVESAFDHYFRRHLRLSSLHRVMFTLDRIELAYRKDPVLTTFELWKANYTSTSQPNFQTHLYTSSTREALFQRLYPINDAILRLVWHMEVNVLKNLLKLEQEELDILELKVAHYVKVYTGRYRSEWEAKGMAEAYFGIY